MGFRVNPNYSPLIGPKYLNAPRPTFSAVQKILRHLAKAEILPRICGGRGPPRPDGDGERGWNINKSRSPNSAAFTCSSCVSVVSFCWMPNTGYKVQVESISMLHQHSTALWGSDVTFYADWQSRQKKWESVFLFVFVSVFVLVN